MSQNNSGRNVLDVSLELTKMHLDSMVIESSEEIKEIYAEYYSLVSTLKGTHNNKLNALLPEEIKNKIK